MSDPEDVAQYKAYANQLLRKPDDVGALINQFAHLFNTTDRNKVHQLVALAERAYRLAPKKFTAVFSYSSALSATGHWLEAIALLKWCVTNAPDNKWLGRAYHHLGIAYRSNGDDEDALIWYDRAIALTGDPEIKKDRALTLLAMGRLREGFQAYECRRENAEEKLAKFGLTPNQALLPAHVRQRHWQGEDLTGKTIAVYAEDGIGDFFNFCRFIPRLRDYGAAKILLTGKVADMVELVADNIDNDGIVPIDDFDADYIVGSMTVPWRTGVDLEDVNGKPYFKAEPATFPRRGLLNVGLVWRGNPVHGRNSHRSMDFINLSPLFGIPDAAFYSLQVGPTAREITAAGYDGFVADLSPLAKSWRATASLIANLDVVVTVDTSCAHLAGALGVPVITMVTRCPDWRWDRNSQRTIWYDSMSVLRQHRQDEWAPVVDGVKIMLESMANGRRRQDAKASERRAPGAAARGTVQKRSRPGQGRVGPASVDLQA